MKILVIYNIFRLNNSVPNSDQEYNEDSSESKQEYSEDESDESASAPWSVEGLEALNYDEYYSDIMKYCIICPIDYYTRNVIDYTSEYVRVKNL